MPTETAKEGATKSGLLKETNELFRKEHAKKNQERKMADGEKAICTELPPYEVTDFRVVGSTEKDLMAGDCTLIQMELVWVGCEETRKASFVARGTVYHGHNCCDFSEGTDEIKFFSSSFAEYLIFTTMPKHSLTIGEWNDLPEK